MSRRGGRDPWRWYRVDFPVMALLGALAIGLAYALLRWLLGLVGVHLPSWP